MSNVNTRNRRASSSAVFSNAAQSPSPDGMSTTGAPWRWVVDFERRVNSEHRGKQDAGAVAPLSRRPELASAKGLRVLAIRAEQHAHASEVHVYLGVPGSADYAPAAGIYTVDEKAFRTIRVLPASAKNS